MKKMCRALFASLFALSLPAFAAPVTLASNWKVVFVSDSNSRFDGLFHVGDDVALSTTFEPATPDVDPQVNRGQYDGAISSLTLTVGSAVFSGNGSIVIRDQGPNGYLFSQQATVATPSLVTLFSFNSSTDLAQQPNADLNWLTAVPPRVDSSTASIFFGSAVVGFTQVGNYRISDVPVPGALLLFNGALALLATARGVARRR